MINFIEMQKLPEYLTKSFLDWQARVGERKTLEEFANYLGVNRSLLSYWMNNSRVPSVENIEKISLRLGNDIYDVLDLPRPTVGALPQTHSFTGTIPARGRPKKKPII